MQHRCWRKSHSLQACAAALLVLSCGRTPILRATAASESSKPIDSAAQTGATAIPKQELRSLDSRIDEANLNRWLPPYLESLGGGWPPGYQPSGYVLISAGGKTLLSQSLGQANYAEDRGSTPRTPFAIGDIGQLFTALSVLRLVDREKLSLNTRLRETLPSCPDSLKELTLEQLLAHTSGVPGLPLSLLASSELPKAEVLSALWQHPVKFEAGSQREASNAGQATLVAALETIVGEPYAITLEREVVTPLGLSATSVGLNPPPAGSAVRYGASPRDGERQRLVTLDLNDVFAADQVLSSANDLLRLQEALTQHTLLSPPSTEKLLAPGLNGYSLGARLGEHRGLKTLHYGSGGRSVAEIHSELVNVPELDLTLIVLSNSASFDARAVAAAALEAALGQPVSPVQPHREVAMEGGLAEHIRGGYLLSAEAQLALKAQGVPNRAIAAMSTASIFLNKQQLFFKPARQGAMRMVPSGPHSFVLRGGKASLTFDIHYEHPDSTLLTLQQGSIEVEYNRKPARQPKKDVEGNELYDQ